MEREDAGGRAIYPCGEEQQHHSCSEACGEDTAGWKINSTMNDTTYGKQFTGAGKVDIFTYFPSIRIISILQNQFGQQIHTAS